MPARAPEFYGSAAGLTPSVGATMTKNAFGIDVLPRPFTCPRARVKELLPKAGTADIYWHQLKATGNFSVTEMEGLQCLVTVEYKGLIDGRLPEALISPSLSTGATSATTDDEDLAPEDQRTWEIVFRSPINTYRYVTEGKPRGPKFNSYEGGPVSAPSTMYQTIKDGTGRSRSSTPGMSLVPKADLTGFVANPVPGTPYYEVEESWAGIYMIRLV